MPWLRAYKATDNRSSLRSGVAEITVSDDVVVHVTEHGSVCFTAKIWVVPRNLFRPLHLCRGLFYASLVKGDAPQCGEMSRSDRGDDAVSGGPLAVEGFSPDFRNYTKTKGMIL